ncbi:DinB family protein [Roseimaritima sediminicola]|uniref:DinB family protein n=1 Tax=Roseimaritima sediminicola TaxID=2662066 RepID=UPI001298469F|nr:DinB family protein [Roseimaritima sediminicola]
MTYQESIEEYAAGPGLLREAVENLSADQLDAVPVPGKWSVRQAVCHIADFEIVYADRIKRVLAEDEPTFFGGDPDQFAAGLAYGARKIDEELAVVESIRAQVARILYTLSEPDFARLGHHNEAGPMSLGQLLEGITEHLPHHVQAIHEKRTAMGV